MLITRVITALVLGVSVLGAVLFTPFWATASLILTFGALASLEWAQLIGLEHRWVQCGFVLLVTGIGGFSGIAGEAVLLQLVFSLALASWALICVWIVLFQREPIRRRGTRAVHFLSGWIIQTGGLAAVLFLAMVSPVGLVGLFTVVWAADSLAFMGGKLWGSHRLASNVSPGKTWEGVLCAVLTAPFVGAFLHYYLGVGSLSPMVVLAVVVTLVAVIGDLFESMIKRIAGRKDSGRLLPGHGGVLDRIDGLLAAGPVYVVGMNEMMGIWL